MKMFSWDIAKSAEAMFSRWAIRRVCKFFLKKKLGQFILGEIDLNQLDVQLRAGTLQLHDLALNVDYLNQKLGAASSVIVKEGSIGSLLVTMPWKGKGCEIEVDELELVISPYGGTNSQDGCEVSSLAGDISVSHDLGKKEPEQVDNSLTNASIDVHEGVRTIAKMVKWLLTSFHVKVKKLIVAFDPCFGDEKNKEFCRSLVLRITEAECGTHISEDLKSSGGDTTHDNFLGLSHLTNYVKFEGATLEFLQMDDVCNQNVPPCASGASLDERYPACGPSNDRTIVVAGERVGFSGTLKLSIPWKNGSLDIQKVDADAHIDPLELRFQPSSIKCFLYIWDSFKNTRKSSKDFMHHKQTESLYFNASSGFHSSTVGSCMLSSDKVLSDQESIYDDCCSPVRRETATDALLQGSRVISDWVPSLINKTQGIQIEDEPDFGASVDQFFECFDGLRNSQSALGNSGMWNWTCSVFNAITAASNLASGSLHTPEQLLVQTNLRVSVAKISLLFSLVDENQKNSSGLNSDQPNTYSNIHYIRTELQGMLLNLQVCPREMNIVVTVEHVELADHFSDDNNIMDSRMHDYREDITSQVNLVQQMQASVLSSLSHFGSSITTDDLGKSSVASDASSAIHSEARRRFTASRSIFRDDVVEVTLLRSSGVSECRFIVNCDSSDKIFTGPVSFSLKLPPFVLWVNFGLINTILDAVKEITNSFEMTSSWNGCEFGASENKCKPDSQGGARKDYSPHVESVSPIENRRGNIFLPNARIILCFPYENRGNFKSYSSWDNFVVLDFSSPSGFSESKSQATGPAPTFSSKKRYSSKISGSLHLNVGNIDIYLIKRASEENVETKCCGTRKLNYFAQNILSATDRTGHLSVVSMIWPKSPATGPWIAQTAKVLATSEGVRSKNKFTGKGHEFASVTTVKDMEDLNAQTRQEMILSSTFFLHARLSPITVNLNCSQYKDLHSLFSQVIDWLDCFDSNEVVTEKESSVSQTSMLVECDSIAVSLNLEVVECANRSIQSELPGSWHKFKLKIRKFELLSVSNIGGISSAHFLRVVHGEGNFWGSITGAPNEELLLISCSTSTMGRGGGDGSNALSSRSSGSDIIYMWDPESFQSHTSITVRCGTIVAPGGRLDWVDRFSSFFVLSSPEIVQAGDNSLQKGDSGSNVNCGSSFLLNLVDIGLSYEPYSNNLVTREVGKQSVACLLAASSLKVSNVVMADAVEREYKIRLQDVGLLLSEVNEPKNVGGTYSVEHLHNAGYVKVAKEAHVEALLTMICKSGHLWKVECSESHVVLDTCHDTTSCLIRLGSQLQQIFTPDLEESIVHLQTRWNNVQKEHANIETSNFNKYYDPSTSHLHTSSVDINSEPVVSLMDEICESAFRLEKYSDGESEFCESGPLFSVNDGIMGETCNISGKDSTEFIEGYFYSDLRPLLRNELSNDVPQCKSYNERNGGVHRGNSGWYGNTSLEIFENHVSEINERTSQQLVESEASCSHVKPDEYGKVMGHVLLKNMNVIWRMYAGSDLHHPQNTVHNSSNIRERDTTVCLELSLSGMDFHYDIFPDGGTCASRLSLSIKNFNLSDKSINAPWKLVLGYYQRKGHPRESSSKALKMNLDTVRPDPLTPLEEYRLRIAFLPVLLHIHQSQLDFLISFFGEGSSSPETSSSAFQDSCETKILQKQTTLGGHTITEEALLPYFQKFDVWPILVRVDYSPCRVDLAALRGGKYVELVNLVPWKGVELELKNVQAVGVYGWGCICETVIGEWLEDISQNQIHKLLKGLPPIRSLVSLGSGAAKLVSLPVKNYRKDHRLLKGMQRGTIAFLRSISLEAIGLGVHLAAGAHDILLQAEYILTTIPPSVPWSIQGQVDTNVRSNQPKGARQGIQQAYESISDGVCKSASALVQTPLKRYQRGAGVGSALATAVQAVPAAAIAPASATARAVTYALLGVRNSLDPEHKKESMDKYLGTTQPREFT